MKKKIKKNLKYKIKKQKNLKKKKLQMSQKMQLNKMKPIQQKKIQNNRLLKKMPLKKNGETLSKQSARCTLVEDLEKTKASNTQPENEDTQTIMG